VLLKVSRSAYYAHAPPTPAAAPAGSARAPTWWSGSATTIAPAKAVAEQLGGRGRLHHPRLRRVLSYGDHPGQSWFTGWTWYDGITSQYERILAHTSTVQGHNYNDAATGARMASGPTQAASAAAHGAQYVTILLGANELRTSSTATMTSTTDFRSQFSRPCRRCRRQRTCS
jgi:hypothetical protein